MPDLIDSPAASPRGAKAPQPVKKAAKKSTAFPVRKVRFGGVEAEDLVDENGMPRDGYDYSQHMKEMGHGGKFYSATGRFDAPASELSRRVELPADVLPSADEQERLLDAITLTTEVMDSDLREALENDAAFEEIEDDFMEMAAADDPANDASDGFDYDAHIAKLMEAASGVPKYKGDLTDSEDDEFDSDEEDDELSDFEVDDADKEEEQRALDALFEKTLAEEYDDEQLGELEDDDPDTRGDVVLEGALLDEIVDDFVRVRQEMLDDEGKLGNPLRTGNQLAQILEACEAERRAEEDEENEENDASANKAPVDKINPVQEVHEADPQVERDLQAMFERNAYLVPREQERWDCETIVSTYSTLDNHPTVLREEPRKPRRKSRAAMSQSSQGAADPRQTKIELSRKTGMPLGVFETAKKSKSKEAMTDASHEPAVDEGRARTKGETKEDKRARKAAVKLLKTQRRLEKKETKLAFKDEAARQATQTPGGVVSIFKY